MSALLNPTAIALAARDFSIARYHQSYVVPVLGRTFTAFIYLGSLFGGIWFATARRRQRWVAMLPIIPALMRGLILTARAGFLLPGILWVAGYLAASVLLATRIRLPFASSLKSLVMTGLVVLLGLGLLAGFQVLRDGLGNEQQIAYSLNKVKSSLFGSPPAFSLWLDRTRDEGFRPTWGQYSFAGPFDALGFGDRQMGLFVDFQQLGNVGMTNIYTMFRAIVQDFTLIGAFFLFGLVGAWSGFAYHRVRNGAYWYIPALILFYSFVLWSYVANILMENTFVLIFLLLPVFFSRWGLRLLRRDSLQDDRTRAVQSYNSQKA